MSISRPTRYATPPKQDEDEIPSPQGPRSMNDDTHAQRRRRLLEDLKVLSSMGLNKVLQLPQLVCIGSQSAGKSSLIETLCKITLPRASGTCTRCPIECRSKYTDQPWVGRVSLRFESDGQNLSDVREIPFGPDMTDPSLMERRIAQAQLAVLCPNDDPNRFLSIDPNRVKASQGFTNNSVVVDILGRDQADLNFVDLPGLIVNVGDGGEASHIEQVQQMVRGYIAKPHSIILLVVACSADFETQGASILAAEYDKKGTRTIGVLTKPDRIESMEDAEQWTAMVSNKANRLAHGWFVVKQPDSKQRKSNPTWEEARQLEADFFRANEIWAKLPPQYRGQLGSTNLSLHLGNILSVALESRFAELRVEIDRIIRETTIKLADFPDPPSTPPGELILELLAGFFKDVRIQMVQGDPSAEQYGVIQTLRHQAYEFRNELQDAVPVFEHPAILGPKPDVTFLHETDRWMLDSDTGIRYTVGEVENRCKEAVLRQNGDFVSFDPTRFYIAQVSKVWSGHAKALLDRAYGTLHEMLDHLVDKHFAKYSHGGLYARVSDLAYELLRRCKQTTETQLMFLVAHESYPRTFHDVRYAERKKEYIGYFQSYSASEAALVTMARTLTMFEIAFQRFSDMVPLSVDLHFVNAFGDQVGGHMTTGLNLLRDQEELAELLRVSDPMLAERDALLDKIDRLRAARRRLSN